MSINLKTILIYSCSLIYSILQAWLFSPPFELPWTALVIILNSFLLGSSAATLANIITKNNGNLLCPAAMSITGFIIFYPATTFVMFNELNQISAQRIYGITYSDFVNMGPELLVTLIGLVIFWECFKFTMNRCEFNINIKTSTKIDNLDENYYIIAAILTYGIGIMASIIWLGGPLEWLKGTTSAFTDAVESGERIIGQANYQYFEIMNNISSIGIILFFFVMYRKIGSLKIGLVLTWIIAIVLSFLAFGYMASRTMVLLVAIWGLVVHSMMLGKIRTIKLVSWGAVLVFLSIAIKYIMFLPWVGNVSSVENLYSFLFDSPAIPFIFGFDLSRMLPTTLLFHYNFTEGWHWGHSYLGSLIHILPNFIWPYERPLNIEQEIAVRAGIDIMAKRSNPIVGMIGEAFFNFSWLGVGFLGLVLGSLVNWLQRFYNRFLLFKNLDDGVVVVLTMVLCFSLTATQSFMLLYQILIYAIILFIYMMIPKLRFKYK